MEYKVLDKKIILRLDVGDEVVTAINEIIRKEKVQLGSVSGIGASDDMIIGVYNVAKQEYKTRNLKGDHEITSIVGNISEMNEKPYVHLHLTASDMSYQVVGGHLNKAIISGTAEIIIQVIDGKVD